MKLLSIEVNKGGSFLHDTEESTDGYLISAQILNKYVFEFWATKLIKRNNGST